MNLYVINFTSHLTKKLKNKQCISDRHSMNIKSIKAFNQSISQMNVNLDEVKKAIQENTTEFKKITKRIEKAEEVDHSDWDKLDPYTEESIRPLAKGTPPAIDVEVQLPDQIIKKLNII